MEVRRFEEAAARRGQRFLDRVFTAAELAYCGQGPQRFRRLAARFAAKEAVLKALGTGLRRASWTDVEIEHDELGRPLVRLGGGVAELAGRAGVAQVLLTLSHTDQYGAAQAVALRGGE